MKTIFLSIAVLFSVAVFGQTRTTFPGGITITWAAINNIRADTAIPFSSTLTEKLSFNYAWSYQAKFSGVSAADSVNMIVQVSDNAVNNLTSNANWLNYAGLAQDTIKSSSVTYGFDDPLGCPWTRMRLYIDIRGTADTVNLDWLKLTLKQK